jgi:hypothetical protein
MFPMQIAQLIFSSIIILCYKFQFTKKLPHILHIYVHKSNLL